MAARFQPKNIPGGRLTPSNINAATVINSTASPSSPSTSTNSNVESDQGFLDRLKVREIISDAFLQVVRLQPDDPIDFLYNYFESQCQTKPYEKALSRLRLADPKHPSFDALLVELYSNFNILSDDILLLTGDLYNKLLDNLCDNQIWSGSKDHRTTLLSLVSLRPNDPVSFNVFKYGIQAVLLAKEFEKLVRSLYNSLTNYAGSSTEIDRSVCEVLLQMLNESLGMINKTPHDAFSLHESIVKLSSHQVKQSLEQVTSQSRSTAKNRITIEEFQNLAMPIYLKTIKRIH